MTTTPRVWTVDELAEAMRVKPWAIAEGIRRGRIKKVLGIKAHRIPDAEAQRLLGGRLTQHTEPVIPILAVPVVPVTRPAAHILYRFFDATGDLLYVGITSQGVTRWVQHSKDQTWWPLVATVTVEHLDTLEDVLAAEVEAIRSERPRHNIAHSR